jgi:lipase
MTGPHYDTFTVAVEGGELYVGAWGPPQAPVVLAVHGITANHLHMGFVARELSTDHRVVAPDLRGRGASATIAGPFGMDAHADDLAAVLDELGAERAVVVGHSMGAFVATTMAARHPERVERLVLVDGGLALGVPQGDVDEVLRAVIGPAMERLSMTFTSAQAYRDFWRAHPALAADWSDVIEAAVDYDLVGAPPQLRSSVSIDAVRADSVDNLDDWRVRRVAEDSRCPIELLWAERGMLDQVPGLYTEESVAPFRSWLGDRLDDRRVDGVNHYTIGLSERGAKEIATAARG